MRSSHEFRRIKAVTFKFLPIFSTKFREDLVKRAEAEDRPLTNSVVRIVAQAIQEKTDRDSPKEEDSLCFSTFEVATIFLLILETTMPTAKLPHILFVEDEILFHRVIAGYFKDKYRCSFAENGKQALEELEKDDVEIDLVVTDIKMPEMDGLTLLKEVNDRGINVKTIIISAHSNIFNFRKAMQQRAFDFLVKPFDLPELEKKINETLQKKPERTTRRGVVKALEKFSPQKQMKILSQLLEHLGVEELEEIKYQLEAQYHFALQEQREKELLSVEDEQRRKEGKIPLSLLQKGYIEERFEKRVLKGGVEKHYGPYFYLRWKEPESEKQFSKFLGKYEDIDDPEILKIIDQKLAKNG